MCKEDLKLGKGRYRGAAVTAVVSTPTLLPPDARRVAILITVNTLLTFDNLGAIVNLDSISITSGDSLTSPLLMMFTGRGETVLLRLEDVGDVVTQALSVVISSPTGAARITMVPILTNLDITPIASGSV